MNQQPDEEEKDDSGRTPGASISWFGFGASMSNRSLNNMAPVIGPALAKAIVILAIGGLIVMTCYGLKLVLQ